MKKIILIVVCSLFVVGVVGTLVLTFFLGGIVKTAVNSFGPKLTQTNVVLEGASLSPISGTGTLTGLKVSNPPGWKNDQAFSLGTIRMSVAPFSIFGDHIIINELTIDEPVFDYETKFTDNNVSQLLGNVQKYAGSGSATPATSGGKPVKFEIKKFRLTNAKVSVGVAGLAAVTVPMPDIPLDNIGSDQGGITPDQLAGVVMKSVSEGVILAGKDAVLKAGTAVLSGATGVGKGAAGAVSGAAAGLKSLLGGTGSK